MKIGALNVPLCEHFESLSEALVKAHLATKLEEANEELAQQYHKTESAKRTEARS